MKHLLLISIFLLSVIYCNANERFLIENDTVLKKRLVVTIENSECTESFYLSNTETQSNYVYNASNTITTDLNYKTTSSNNELIMKAGNTIVLKPDSYISKGSLYLARIEPCTSCDFEFTYPKFFTPNGDNYNDNWKIDWKNSQQTVPMVYIFDQYGKLIKTLCNSSDFWDGTYNNQLFFSNDYWFKLEYVDCNGKLKEFKSHFALKR